LLTPLDIRVPKQNCIVFAGGNIDILVQNGAVDALVPHLSAPPLLHRDDHVAYEHEVEKDAAFALGLLAIKVRGFTLLVVFSSRKSLSRSSSRDLDLIFVIRSFTKLLIKPCKRH
jgi:hypothetical protein